MKFEVTEEQKKKINDWLYVEVYPAAIAKQKKAIKNPDFIYTDSWASGYPYLGAIGGGLTYEFTPTSLGDVLIVKFDYVGMELNVTDYESW